MFVEEFPYATGRGVISVAELGDDGIFGVPRVVLEEAHHLSYPQVFAHAGEIFMIPESSAAREVVLYRAAQFPDRWVRDTVLIADRNFNDATLLGSDGRFWLLGTEWFGHGSASDTMVVYSAPSLRGPWTAHALNPIAVDHSATRPGGAFIRQGDALVLPVQNGSRAYGGGLGLMRLERLDDFDVRFTPPRPIEPGTAWARAGIHTLNRAGKVEVVDSAG
ncbi:glucosamine inositolphosphorylceramide transferase family protein [Mesorhizobium sanjuanii]|uniref:glucosamine inositolphosphorylceramide transferase family protein n=1 Tax=Mesorhizobium sanjuanii TaxID=2037900 RepID=UPI003CC96F52